MYNEPDPEFPIGAIAEFKDDPDRWGIVKSLSDDGSCVYLKRFGKGVHDSIGYSGISREEIHVPDLTTKCFY